ncbi:LOW QUALITY PROTEIN: hypothetical protein Cgig2_024416 [Carnegiea gigantea]|uniref:Terpene cyclase/mutase family member n=1 Tax=Carnegiea gigantea TaxID=171969 RepID=A0A9Q1KLN0_9CARY|nr:LOW QUALITY PROTEIN: hypothetical protein Cgig2_024416 [Carnegiea gigantea]
MFQVMALYIIGSINHVLSSEHQKEIKRYIYNHQNEDGGWGLHIEGQSTMFGTTLSYIALRLLGEGPNGGEENAVARGRQWILEHGGAIGVPSWGKFWLTYIFLKTEPVFKSYQINIPPFTPVFLGIATYLVCTNGKGATPCPQSSGYSPKSLPYIQVSNSLPFVTLFSLYIFLNTSNLELNIRIFAGKMLCYCRLVYMPMSYLYGKRFVGPLTPLIQSLRKELYIQPYHDINWNNARNTCAKEDLYYPHPMVQDMLWGFLHHFAEPLLNHWPFSKVRDKAMKIAMQHVHYEDQNSRYLCIGCVEKVLCLIACWVEDPSSDRFKRHLARIPDYLWIAEDGMKMQSFGSQMWDEAFAIQAILASGLIEDYAPTLRKAHDFVKASQVRENPSGNFKEMYRHISKGAWTFSIQDHGWQVSDCTAEGLKKFNPTEFFEDVLIEREYVECTSSAIQALSLFKKFYPTHRRKEVENSISKAVQYIENSQNPDGSWYGCWGICFTYGTWFAVDALVACGRNYQSSVALRKACKFLLSKQLPDGGWGESYLSGQNKEITGIFMKTCTLSYSGYRNIFPIWALGEYRQLQARRCATNS